jgi:D-tyrosyl-tRNA(Tyr) deacylase
MRAVIQRVSKASVEIDNNLIAEIGNGFVVLLGITLDDDRKDAEYLAAKTANLRVFEDDLGKMNVSLLEKMGEVLAISQFTLYSDTRKGRRPSFIKAAPPEKAEPLYNSYIKYLKDFNIKVVTGIFGAMMMVNIHNDGPVTIIIDSTDRHRPRK